eukprot:1292735-Amphidinium_carterae.1
MSSLRSRSSSRSSLLMSMLILQLILQVLRSWKGRKENANAVPVQQCASCECRRPLLASAAAYCGWQQRWDKPLVVAVSDVRPRPGRHKSSLGQRWQMPGRVQGGTKPSLGWRWQILVRVQG